MRDELEVEGGGVSGWLNELEVRRRVIARLKDIWMTNLLEGNYSC